MNNTNTKSNPIIYGTIWKQLLLFFFPIVLGTFFQQIYNTADAVIVGHFVGKEALASVGGSASQIINVILGFFIGLSSGATVVISQFYGAKDRQNINYALHTAIALCIVGSIVIAAIGIPLSPFLLRLMRTPEALMEPSLLYLRILLAGILFTFLYNIGSGILRAVGDSKRPLYFLIICCVLNIILDIVFVLGFHMGVAGAALGTLISQAVSAILILYTLVKSTDLYKLSFREIRFHGTTLKMLLRIGVPAGLQSVMFSLSNTIIQTCLNSFGTDTVAAWTAFGKMDALYWLVISAFGISITTFIGQNYGAGKYSRMRKGVRTCLGMALISSVLLSAVFLLFGTPLFRMFTSDAEVIKIGMAMVRYMVPAYSLYVFIEILSGALRGIGNVVIPMLISCFGICVLRLVWLAIAVPIRNDINTIMFSYPLSWIITAILFIVYYSVQKKKWPTEDKN